ncbi:hypothetical protein J6590_045773 [Homalodisca vitripennis]|nr:hypothetical protein J6590_045773 [Homalodisca vitripennis]
MTTHLNSSSDVIYRKNVWFAFIMIPATVYELVPLDSVQQTIDFTDHRWFSRILLWGINWPSMVVENLTQGNKLAIDGCRESYSGE